MEEKIFELGDYSFLKKSKIQRSNLIKVTIFYITTGIMKAFIIFFLVIALAFKLTIPISVVEFLFYSVPISTFLFFAYQGFKHWKRYFQIINSPSRLILNDYEIMIDKKKFSYENINIIKMTHPKPLNDKRIVIIQKNGSKYKNFLYFFIKRDYSQNYLAIFLQMRKICQEKKIEFVVEEKEYNNILENK